MSTYTEPTQQEHQAARERAIEAFTMIRQVVRNIRRSTGEITPLMLLRPSKRVEGKDWVMTDIGEFFRSPETKERFAQTLPMMAEQLKIRAGMIITEAWGVFSPTQENLDEYVQNNKSLENHPDAKDVVMVSYEEPGYEELVIYEALENGGLSEEPVFDSTKETEDADAHQREFNRFRFFPNPQGIDA